MKLLYVFFLHLLAGSSLNAQDRGDSIYTNVDSAATYQGGKAGWSKFLQKNMRYPQEAQDNEIHGVIAIRFVVDIDGSISEVKAISGPVELRPEGVRMISLSGKWLPATINGQPVKAYKIQEFTFKIVTR